MSLEERASPTNAADFHAEVDDVFERIASRYDLLCDLFSFGIHWSWKRRVATLIASEPWTDLHDAATGTGDVILRVARQGRLQAHQKIVASDMSSRMLALARKRATSIGAPVEFKMLDAHAMPSVPGESVDLYSMSLGLKICERQQVLREAERIYYDPAAIRAELARLEEQLEAGEITEEEFDRQEDELLDRLETAMRTSATGDGTAPR